MSTKQDERIANMKFSSVYPCYVTKVEKKGRTKEELDKIITWLTNLDSNKVQQLIDDHVTFEEFFQKSSLHPNDNLDNGVICGYSVEEIKNPLTQKVRYLDKLVDELAKGKAIHKILRTI